MATGRTGDAGRARVAVRPRGRAVPWLAAWPLLAVALVVVAAYAPMLGRAFVSEDYVVLGRLARGRFLELLAEQLTGPWLGIDWVPFYRPVPTILVQLEQLVLGQRPEGYLVLHLGVHLVNVGLVHAIARTLWGRDDRVAAVAAALVFALYPLHPNAVVFVAAYATLFAATFGLGAFLARQHGAWRAGLLLYVLALVSYEQSVVLPALFVVHDLLLPRGPGGRRTWSWRRDHVPFWIATLAYLVLRRLLLGSVVGGYGDIRTRIEGGEVAGAVERLAHRLSSLAWPRFEVDPTDGLALVAGLVLVLGTAVALVRRRAGGDGPRWWLLGAAWILVTQVPLAFPAVVPANGRYWYVTSVGLALLVVAVGVGLPAPRRVPRAARVLGPALLVAAAHLPLLLEVGDAHREAGALARRLRDGARELPARRGKPLFLGGHPEFLTNERGVPLAQVFQWGLADALRPPFAPTGTRAYPLPYLGLDAIRPVLKHPEAVTAWWADGSWFLPPPPDGPPPGRVHVRRSEADELVFAFRSPAPRHRLVVINRINPQFVDLTGAPDEEGWIAAALPREVVALGRHLCPDVVFWWVEGRDPDRRLVSLSRLEMVLPRTD